VVWNLQPVDTITEYDRLRSSRTRRRGRDGIRRHGSAAYYANTNIALPCH
jgi:hypothetical protein